MLHSEAVNKRGCQGFRYLGVKIENLERHQRPLTYTIQRITSGLGNSALFLLKLIILTFDVPWIYFFYSHDFSLEIATWAFNIHLPVLLFKSVGLDANFSLNQEYGHPL